MEGTRKLMVEKVIDLQGAEEIKRGAIEFLREKLVQLLHLLDDFGRFFTEKVDQVFPPATRAETLHRWVHVGLTVVLPIVLAVVFLYYFRHCCCRCGGVAGRAAVKMMRAPGAGGLLISRLSFTINPRTYFQLLRAGGDLVSKFS